MLKQYFGWAWFMWAGAPGLVMGSCVVEIDRIVIREVQYHLEVNRCRNEEVTFQGSSANSVGGDSCQDGRTDGGANQIIPRSNLEHRVVIRDLKQNFGPRPNPHSPLSPPVCKFKGSSANSVGGNSGQVRRTDSGDQ
ncbi:hypothetical protein DPMN_008703 [Dreissena polymorpha]|uniref:Secreted protein n=1 Tax=Dreissena polymorpha TaxID=45954 RepID=A0A9D4RZY7_DREPO|nr:hypothetical protein DPMN_008703 [Dreissena polymorpha]